MTHLEFSIAGAAAEKYAAAPTLRFRIRVAESGGNSVHALLLRAQIRIEPRRREHSGAEKNRLLDMFGEPARWGETLKSLFWMQTVLLVPAFENSIEAELAVPCTYDFEVAGAKYFAALDDGEIPLRFLFSGTAYVRGGNGFLVEQIPWDREAAWRMPVRLWREAMDTHFPGCAWIRLQRDTLDALERYKASHALPGWDQAIAELLRPRQ